MIRPAVVSDLEQVGKLLRESFDPSLRPYMVYAQHGASAFLAVYISNPLLAADRTLLIASGDDGRVVGFAEFRRGGDPAHLSYICVHPEMRGRGIAQALLRHFAVHSKGVCEIDLQVFADNGPAVALYQKLGFSIAGETNWYTRPLPTSGDGVADGICVPNLPAAMAAFAQFGFCELQIDWHGRPARIGRIGPSTLRCFDPAGFTDDDLLARLAAALPAAQNALLIAQDDPGIGRPVNRSIRMVGTIQGTQRD